MRLSEFKQLIKQTILEEKESGAMTPEEEEMVADYEKEQDAKHALDKEEPLEENEMIPNDIEWEVDEVDEKLDAYNSSVILIGTSKSTGKTYTATAMATDTGGGDWEFDDITDIEEIESLEEVITKTESILESWSTKKKKLK